MAVKLGIFLLIVGNIVTIKAQPTITSLLSPSWSHCVNNLHALKTRWKGFTSPNFPNGITTQTQCSWIITANPNYKVRISYHTMNLTGSTNNCYTQYVEIIDITAGSSQGKECGARRPRDYVSQGTKLRIDLKADTAATNHQGFSIKYIATRERPGFKSRHAFNVPRPARRGRPGGAGSGPSAGGGAAAAGGGAGGRVNLNQLQNRRRGNQGRPNARRPAAAAGAAGPGGRVVPAGAPAGASGPRVAPGSPAAPTRSSLFVPIIRRRPPAAAAPIQNHPSVHQNIGIALPKEEEKKNELNLPLILGISGGGLLFLILLAVLVKIFLCKKDKKKEAAAKSAPQASALAIMNINNNPIQRRQNLPKAAPVIPTVTETVKKPHKQPLQPVQLMYGNLPIVEGKLSSQERREMMMYNPEPFLPTRSSLGGVGSGEVPRLQNRFHSLTQSPIFDDETTIADDETIADDTTIADDVTEVDDVPDDGYGTGRLESSRRSGKQGKKKLPTLKRKVTQWEKEQMRKRKY
ncbi:uncharacterized protein LOC100181672 [Ciona intestinalis]